MTNQTPTTSTPSFDAVKNTAQFRALDMTLRAAIESQPLYGLIPPHPVHGPQLLADSVAGLSNAYTYMLFVVADRLRAFVPDIKLGVEGDDVVLRGGDLSLSVSRNFVDMFVLAGPDGTQGLNPWFGTLLKLTAQGVTAGAPIESLMGGVEDRSQPMLQNPDIAGMIVASFLVARTAGISPDAAAELLKVLAAADGVAMLAA